MTRLCLGRVKGGAPCRGLRPLDAMSWPIQWSHWQRYSCSSCALGTARVLRKSARWLPSRLHFVMAIFAAVRCPFPLSLSLYIYIYIHTYILLHQSLSIYLSIYIYIYRYRALSVSLFFSRSLYHARSLSLSLYHARSLYLSVYLYL